VTDVRILGGGVAGVAAQAARRPGLVSRQDLHIRTASISSAAAATIRSANAELTPDDVAFNLDDICIEHDPYRLSRWRSPRPDRRHRSVTLADGTTATGDSSCRGGRATGTSSGSPARPSSRSRSTRWPMRSTSGLASFSSSRRRAQPRTGSRRRTELCHLWRRRDRSRGRRRHRRTPYHDVMRHRIRMEIESARVIVVRSGRRPPRPRVLDAAHGYAPQTLKHRRRGLDARRRVSEVAPDHVTLTDGTSIPTHLTVWGCGEKAAAIVETSRSGRFPRRPRHLSIRTCRSGLSGRVTRSVMPRTSRARTAASCPNSASWPQHAGDCGRSLNIRGEWGGGGGGGGGGVRSRRR